MSAPAGSGDRLESSELRRRASAGVVIVAGRGAIMLLLGFGGNVVLARLLVPADFGVIAIGLTVVALAQAMSDGGLGAGLIRRPESPTRNELRAMLGLQLALTVGIAGLSAMLAIATLGRTGEVVAIMVASLPFIALQTPGKIVLERALDYRPVAVVDVSQVIAYYGWAIPGVIAGFGVWALATAAIARALTASLLLMRLSGLGALRPRFALAEVRPLLGFGVRYQAANLVWVVRDQTINVATAAIAGVATLGLWTMARKLLEIPLLLFESLWRVSFPAMSQLNADEEDLRPIVERGIGLAAAGSGLLLGALAASAPGLVPGLFGPQWAGAAEVLPFACAALLVGGPVSVATVGYLYAVDRASTVLRATIVLAVVWLAVGLALLPAVGVAALGIGWLAGSIADAAVLGRATARHCGARILGPLLTPVCLAAAASGAGWLVADALPPALPGGLAGGVVALALLLPALYLVRRALLLELFAFGVRALRSAAGRDRAPEVAVPESIPA